MKPIKIDNLFSEEELFFLYNYILTSPGWIINASPEVLTYTTNKNFSHSPQLIVKSNAKEVFQPALYLYGQSIIYRLKEILKDKKVGLYPKIDRMWFNITYSGGNNHWLHPDSLEKSPKQSIVLFLTPVWKTGWSGSFYVDGKEFTFQPGSAVIFDSTEFHTGENPISATYNWLRLTCNIVVEK